MSIEVLMNEVQLIVLEKNWIWKRRQFLVLKNFRQVVWDLGRRKPIGGYAELWFWNDKKIIKRVISGSISGIFDARGKTGKKYYFYFFAPNRKLLTDILFEKILTSRLRGWSDFQCIEQNWSTQVWTILWKYKFINSDYISEVHSIVSRNNEFKYWSEMLLILYFGKYGIWVFDAREKKNNCFEEKNGK